MSPPCVAFFNGDNGGATYQGVTRDEITAVVNEDGNSLYNVGDGVEQAPPLGQYCDIDKPPDSGDPACSVANQRTDHKFVRFVRAFSRVFNDRYQTYGRRVHYWLFWGRGGINATAESRRSDAIENFNRLHPFAALDVTIFAGNDTGYADEMARHGILLFSGFSYAGQPESLFRQYAPQIWSFPPDIEHWAAGYSTYVCTKVAPNPVTHAVGGITNDGQPMNGRPRRYALIYNADPNSPQLQRLPELVRPKLAACGVKPVVEIGYPTGTQPASTQAATDVAKLRTNEATTLLLLGGASAGNYVTPLCQASDSAKYYPEVIIAGDGTLDQNTNARLRSQSWMRNGWIVSHQIGYYRFEEDTAYQACREGDPGLSNEACDIAAVRYRDHFMLFKAIQAAGPRLTPQSIDKGFHAIPRAPSTNHALAACFFDAGDYTCVKDFIEEWWDTSKQVPGRNAPGCYRMTRGGQRFLAGTWLASDDVFKNQDDPCNSYSFGGVVDN